MGFNLVGVTRADPSPRLDAYLRWIDAGMHGEMGYMARPDRQARRRDLNVILPGVRSLVVVGLDYRTVTIPMKFSMIQRAGESPRMPGEWIITS